MPAALAAHAAPPPIRTRRERLIQVVLFEMLGLALVAPLYALAAGASPAESLGLLIVLSLVVSAWSALYCSAFDRIEARCTGRVASDRPHVLRLAHAVGHEASAVLATWPVIFALTPLGWRDALLADLGLTLAYIAYGYAFHWAFDRLRPVRREAVARSPMP